MQTRLNFEIDLLDQSKPWVVFIHGAGGSIATWKYQREEFKKYFNLLLIDLRDHGGSKDLNPAYTSYDFDIVSQDIIHTLDYVGIRKATFVSLSFGSVLIQSLMLRRPDLVSKSILAGGVFYGTLHLKAFVHLARLLNLVLPYHQMYNLFSKFLMPLKSQQKARRIYAMQARKLSSDEYVKWLGLYSSFFLLLNRFINQSVASPTLLVMGKNDYMFLPAARKYAAKHPEVQLCEIEKAGHICNIDNPETFNKRVINFLVS